MVESCADKKEVREEKTVLPTLTVKLSKREISEVSHEFVNGLE